jgi:hypothetical protein
MLSFIFFNKFSSLALIYSKTHLSAKRKIFSKIKNKSLKYSKPLLFKKYLKSTVLSVNVTPEAWL